ncbi:MAG: hypothetical protein KF884_05555 [Fimbriimonadaceae bacterium]|nr:hypothetical protein [Fimbriimonadaceae bacterium]QYK59551.1 MAG: hypothetical protein KF884_05555 [Fimbriimonadaceae bacterium]
MTITPLYAFVALAGSFNWQLDYTELLSGTAAICQWSYANYGEEPVTTVATWSSSLKREVAGAEETGPAWTSKFTPLSLNWNFVGETIPGVSVAAKTVKQRMMTLNREIGAEQWSGGEPPNYAVARRTRTWEGPYFMTWREDPL